MIHEASDADEANGGTNYSSTQSEPQGSVQPTSYLLLEVQRQQEGNANDPREKDRELEEDTGLDQQNIAWAVMENRDAGGNAAEVEITEG